MKTLILLIAIGITSQELEQRSDTRSGSGTKGAPAAQSLENRLLDRAKLVYGPDPARTITLASRRPPRATEKAEAEPGQGKPSDSPFGDSTDMEGTKEASYKGDAASGVILLEEKDALYLDVAPCRPKTVVLTFHSPFAKKRVGSLSCNGKDLDKYSVAQR